MEELLFAAAKYVELAVEAIAVLMIAIGSLEAVVSVFRVMLDRAAAAGAKRQVWLHYARWLVIALTFQLAADIVHTAVAPSWDDVGRLAAIAVIRTFLTYFLDRDLERQTELERGIERPAAEARA
ncbi:MAG TPA: DUF1622 domain-containing protein [Thermoanaerobaculia bacterium]|nr:DUF1622 domain-containing protein [Thermoanaerobaculia bacterium]